MVGLPRFESPALEARTRLIRVRIAAAARACFQVRLSLKSARGRHAATRARFLIHSSSPQAAEKRFETQEPFTAPRLSSTTDRAVRQFRPTHIQRISAPRPQSIMMLPRSHPGPRFQSSTVFPVQARLRARLGVEFGVEEQVEQLELAFMIGSAS